MTAEQARALRLSQTDAERKLWTILRRRQMAGRQFRRQASIGPYIVDFVCFSEKLVIEVDGGQHAVDQKRDALRTEWLQTQGFRVLRFWNNDVLTNSEGIGRLIVAAIAGTEVRDAISPPP